MKRQVGIHTWLPGVIDRLLRRQHSQGFGVQSPWAYQFLRYVVCESYPYYAYATLGHSYSHVDEKVVRLAMLYFRLANYCQAPSWTILSNDAEMKAEYIQAGCRSTTVTTMEHPIVEGSIDTDVLLLSLKYDAESLIHSFLSHAHSKSLLILEDLHFSKHALQLWSDICENSLTGITFDLDECGLVFFDRQFYKQAYHAKI